MRYSVTGTDMQTSAVADTYETMLALIAADTAGHRARLLSLAVGIADDAPGDLQLAVSLQRVDDVSAGGVGTPGASPTPVPKDSQAIASVVTAGDGPYTAEPTTYGDPIWEIELNRRDGFIKEWAPEDAPIINRDQLLGVLCAPRTGAACQVTITMEFEVY